MPPSGSQALVDALWEKSRPLDGEAWTSFAYSVVDTQGPALVAGSKDVASFCPAYASLSREQKISFWVLLVSAVAKFESGFDPTSRMKETGLGTDPVTKLPVYSEGLLQLSYQDVRPYPFCSEFDWAKDKTLGERDLRKTILDPYKNLRCGIRILNQLVGKKQLIGLDTGYWSTLRPNNKHTQVKNIQALTQQIAFCRK